MFAALALALVAAATSDAAADPVGGIGSIEQ
jgi:hypothetical protein